MTEIIAALQEEIAAAQGKLKAIDSLESLVAFTEAHALTGYIEGMKKAVDLLTKEAVPFTAENGEA